jgi:hypothetical protein
MFEKGDPRINRNGRPRGSRNKLQATMELLAQKGWHPVEELWKLYKKTPSDKLKKEILVALLPYCEGKIKDRDAGSLTSPEESKQAAEETLKMLKELESQTHKKKE